MRRMESMDDEMRGVITYKLDDGRYIRLDARAVQEYGLEEVLKYSDAEMPKGRLPVFQRGREIGSVPASFEPMFIRSTSFLYDVRPGDFTRTTDGWVASGTLGPGDFDCIPEFTRS